MIIGLCGRKRVGKDTFADYLVENYGFKKYSFAGPLKEACRQMFCFNDEQLYGEEKEEYDPNWNTTCRKILQKFGTEIMRGHFKEVFPECNLKDTFWIYRFKIWYRQQLKKNPNTYVVISDCRFQDEIDAVNELGGMVYKLKRKLPHTNNDLHISEKGIDNLENYENIVKNESTINNYKSKIDMMMTSIGLYKNFN